ncbi:hypothetical protein [Halorubrum vacuolatum]|uniref:Small CPxCG-related zinc finger protein n=1 Tax=Halorubrum vacuolatum TaxID=63740 RepID=A0A238WEE3_HALVU|nr:hypothetical protein [Halorubrum vacuolatum]SNR44952.1 hypothetical protein SAMN06264855_10780 [Halorubrum vacuolatum]
MSGPLTCPQCGETIESADDLESEEVSEMEVSDDGSISVYSSNKTFFRCRKCRTAMGVGHS